MLKRLMDIGVSAIALAVCGPLLFLLALLVRLYDGGPAFYRGVRVGRHRKTFRILKLRTMIVGAEGLGGSSTPQDDPRLTRMGKYLRRHKLDELPQLINVLKGEMSLVGPRPQVPWAVELYGDEAKELLGVRPGMTDYA